MDIAEAINMRKSIRAFRSDPIPQNILKEILELAQRAPSWTNIQPWEFAVVTGSKLEEIRQKYLERMGQSLQPDISRPSQFPEPYDTRRQIAIAQSHEAQGIKRDDKEARTSWERLQLTNFGSPCEIYICIDRSLYHQNDSINVWPVFDCGMVIESILLLATKFGLGTIIQAQSVVYPDILRKILGISENKLIVIGLAIGYPDWDNSLNKMQTGREPLNQIACWYGFDL